MFCSVDQNPAGMRDQIVVAVGDDSLGAVSPKMDRCRSRALEAQGTPMQMRTARIALEDFDLMP